MWNASQICMPSFRRGHANLLGMVPISEYVLPKQVLSVFLSVCSMTQIVDQKSCIVSLQNTNN